MTGGEKMIRALKAEAWDEGYRGGALHGLGPLALANPYRCPRCEATPGDNDHCVYDGAAHGWHRCGGINAPDSDCPSGGSDQ